jgi:hypothetical protein
MSHEAIYNTHPSVISIDDSTGAFDVNGNSVVIDQSLVDAEVIRLQAEYDSQEYARNRKAEYDQLNQFEMQFDDNRDGTTTWVDAINEIKARYPK